MGGALAGVRAWILGAALVTVALTATGCESTQEESAKLEKTAHHTRLAERGLTVVRQSIAVRVLRAVLVHGTEDAAAVVTLRNDSSHALRAVPIAIAVKGANGSTVFQNNAPGLEAALTSLGSLPAHGEGTWIDDQVPANGAPANVIAIVGEPPTANGPVPQIEVAGVHAGEESGSVTASGTVRNRSSVTQQALVVYVVARRAGQVVAAGRAILPEVSPGAAVPFQAFLVGAPVGARLEASAPASTFG